MQDDFLKNKIDDSLAFLEHCSELLNEGKIVKLDEFEKDMVRLCAKIEASKNDDAKIHLTGLKTIIEKLGLLEARIQQRKTAIKTELESLNAGHKAATAYVKTPKGSDN